MDKALPRRKDAVTPRSMFLVFCQHLLRFCEIDELENVDEHGKQRRKTGQPVDNACAERGCICAEANQYTEGQSDKVGNDDRGKDAMTSLDHIVSVALRGQIHQTADHEERNKHIQHSGNRR